MSWIALMIVRAFTGIMESRAGKWVVAIGAAVLGGWVLFLKGGADKERKIKAKQNEDYIARREQGIAAARDADERGRKAAPEEQLAEIRKNTGEW